VGSLSGRTKAPSLSGSGSLPPPGVWPCLVSRFLAASQARGSPPGQENGTGPLRLPPYPRRARRSFPHPRAARPQLSLLFPGQQLPLSQSPRDALPGEIQPGGTTREQAVRVRNTSVGDCFKTRLFPASRRTSRRRKKCPASQCRRAPGRSPAQPCPLAASTSASPSELRPPSSLPSVGTEGGGHRGKRR